MVVREAYYPRSCFANSQRESYSTHGKIEANVNTGGTGSDGEIGIATTDVMLLKEADARRGLS